MFDKSILFKDFRSIRYIGAYHTDIGRRDDSKLSDKGSALIVFLAKAGQWNSPLGKACRRKARLKS